MPVSAFLKNCSLWSVVLADERLDFSKDVTGVFEPTDEWKKVEPG